MRRLNLAIAAAAIVGGVFSSASMAEPPSPQNADAHTHNLHEIGRAPRVATFEAPDGQRRISSDLAFQGKLAYQGTYDGFRVINIAAPGNPKLVSEVVCNGDQGDLIVWDHILVRSWNTKRAQPRECAGTTVPAGFEGVHIFDIGNPARPRLLGALELPCGSHTLTVAGVDGGSLIVYSNNSSSAGCGGVGLTPEQRNTLGDFMDIIEVPLGNPAAASLMRREPLAGPTDPAVATGCHDAGVILGGINKAACASADTINVWDISNPRDPSLLFTITEPGVGGSTTNGRWHSATFTWDGRVIAAGWEPGGGGQAECEAGDPAVDKSMFFYDAATGAKLGQWVLPRSQGADENCTIHNYNIVPLRSGRYLAVGGHYQAGTWAVDFTDPANPRAVGWSDPPSLGPGSFCTPEAPCQIGGAWSSYWYNNFIYESDITAGLRVLRLSDKAGAGAIRLDRLNPQTQEALPR